MVRGGFARKRFIACVQRIVHLQALVRSHLACQRYAAARSSAVQIQSAVRAYHCRREFLRNQKAAIVLQKLRRMLIRRKAPMWKPLETRQQVAAASTIQAVFRGWTCRRKLSSDCVAVIKIQRIYRGSVHRGLYQQIFQAVVVLQKFVRRRGARQTAKVLNNAATQIQRMHRGTKHRISVKEIVKAAASVQRRKLQFMAAAVVIQKQERQRAARHRFKKQRYSTVVIQRTYRGSIRRREIQKRWKARDNSSKIIQRMYRGYYIRLLFKRSVAAALVVQKYERRRSAKERLDIAISSACFIQSFARAHRDRNYVRFAFKAAVTLQSLARMLICVKSFQSKRDEARQHAKTIQKWWRSRRGLESESQSHAGVLTLPQLGHEQARQHIYTEVEAARIIQSIYGGYIQRKLSAEHARSIEKALMNHVKCSEKPSPTRVHDKYPDIPAAKKEATIVVQKAGQTPTRIFEHDEVAIPSDHCTWLGLASCIELESNGLSCSNTEYITALLADETATQESGPREPHRQVGNARKQIGCGLGPNRKRSKIASKFFYASVVSIALVACTVQFPMTVKPALATSKTALELQLRAVQSQVARSRGQAHQIQQHLSNTLKFHPFFTKAVESSKVPRKSTQVESDPIADSCNIEKDLEALFESHHSAVATVFRLQSAIRTLVEDAVVQGQHHTPCKIYENTPVMTPSQIFDSSRECGVDCLASCSTSEEDPTISDRDAPQEEVTPSYGLGGWWTPVESSLPSSSLQQQDQTRSHDWFSKDDENSLSGPNSPTPQASEIEQSYWSSLFRSEIVVVVAEEDVSADNELVALAKDASRSYLNEWRYLI
eukprot:scaffold38418_cov168-Amphora_coffeaeformis.AAC.1